MWQETRGRREDIDDRSRDSDLYLKLDREETGRLVIEDVFDEDNWRGFYGVIVSKIRGVLECDERRKCGHIL